MPPSSVITSGVQRRRDRAAVEREYGTEKWPAVDADLDRVLAELSAGDDLSRVVNLTRIAGGTQEDPVVDVIVDGRLARLPAGIAYAAHRSAVVRRVLSKCRPDTSLIVDLGAGWGHLLFTVWSDGGPRDATYVAAEPTQAGRSVTERIAALEPRIDVRTIEFDHGAPRLDQLAGGHRHAVVYSSHSVEQARHLGSDWIDQITALADEVDVVQFEPVGWQTGAAPISSEAYAIEHDYNRDLVPTLRAAEDEGRIVIDRMEIDVLGVNPRNPSTLIGWRSPGEAITLP